MKVKIISTNKAGDCAEIVIAEPGFSMTKHVVRVIHDGLSAWRDAAGNFWPHEGEVK